MKDENGKGPLAHHLDSQTDERDLLNLKISMESTHLDGDLKTINLKVLYKDSPPATTITRISTVATGPIYSQPKTVAGIVELPVLANARNLQLRTEYMFEGEANIDNELSEVMGTVNPIAMRNCALKLEGEEPKPGEERPKKS